MFRIEKFSQNDKPGYKIVGATFASSKNNNGAYFDPVEVFSLDNPPLKFNFGHKDYDTDFSTGTQVTTNPTAAIDGKMLRFTWDIETTNENFVALIEADNFGGFSPELEPKNKPIRSDLGERFYRAGDLVWDCTAILGKGQKPGFVGANEYALEKFSIQEDVVIKEVFEQEQEVEPLPENNIETETKPKEKFYSWVEVGSYCTTPDNKIGKVISITQSEGETNKYEVKMIDGTTQVFSDSQDNNVEVLGRLCTDDLADYLFRSTAENFTENKTVETDDPTKIETDKIEQQRLEKLNKNAKEAFQMKEIGTVEEFSKSETVGKEIIQSNNLTSAFTKLFKK